MGGTIECSVTCNGELLINFLTDVKPSVGEFLHFHHLGGYKILQVCHHVSDDMARTEDSLMWVELICEKLEPKGV